MVLLERMAGLKYLSKNWCLTVVQCRALAELHTGQLSCLPFLHLSPT